MTTTPSPAPEAQTPSIRQYYYRANGCHAASPDSPDCVCWYDEGTGPFADGKDMENFCWRDKPAPAVAAEPTPTPRTDANLTYHGDVPDSVPASFSRELERELAAMTTESQRNREAGQEWAAKYYAVTKERNELAEAIRPYRSLNDYNDAETVNRVYGELTACHGTIARLKEALERVSKEPYCNCSHQVVRDIANTALASASETYADELAKARAEVERLTKELQKLSGYHSCLYMDIEAAVGRGRITPKELIAYIEQDRSRLTEQDSGYRAAMASATMHAEDAKLQRLAGAFLALLAFVGFHREKLPDYPESMPDLKEAQNIAARRKGEGNMSTPTKDGGPAFPQLKRLRNDSGTGTVLYAAEMVGGMTLRDWFAGQLVSGLALNVGDGCAGYMEQRARVAYQFADAMLAAREAQP